MDVPAHRQTVEDVLKIANDYELFILHTSTPSLSNDTKRAEAIKNKNPDDQDTAVIIPGLPLIFEQWAERNISAGTDGCDGGESSRRLLPASWPKAQYASRQRSVCRGVSDAAGR